RREHGDLQCQIDSAAMQFRRMLATSAAAVLAVAAGCSSSSNSANSNVVSDVILGSSDVTPLESDSTSPSSTSSGPPTTLSPGSDAAPRVPNGAVMAATIMVSSGRFSGKSTIESNGSVGCSYSLFGDKLWRINFNSQGEFESTDTTS